jgi:heat shock protein HtpX
MRSVALHEAAIRRNRRRIVGLVVVAVLNFWIAAIIFTFCVVVGSILALVGEGVVEGLDFEVLGALLRALPAIVRFLAVDVFTSPAAAVIALAFVVAGSIVAAVTLVSRLGRVERRVLGETGARVADPGTNVEVENLLNGLAISADVPAPRFAILEDPAPNAFAIGRRPEQAIVVLTSGLLATLSRDETEAVLSYEISRIASLDIALSTWAVAVTGQTIEQWETSSRLTVRIGLWVPKLLAERLRSLSLRGQTAQQDMLAVRFTRNPRSLLDALVKLEADDRVIAHTSTATAPLWLEYPGWEGPSLAERIAGLRDLLREPPTATAPAPG